MKASFCIGGIVIEENRLVRLLAAGGSNQPSSCDWQIGEIRDMEFTFLSNPNPPHVEDVLVKKVSPPKRHLTPTEIKDWIKQQMQSSIWKSSNALFGGNLGWTGKGSGFISHLKIPSQSVGFWLLDRNLEKCTETRNGEEKIYYEYKEGSVFAQTRRIPYVGFSTSIDIIPKGTLVRVSLARWWAPQDTDIEQRCYLQLSGWYL
jgi:hypothetical protein